MPGSLSGMMPWRIYDSIIETLEILDDEELMVALRQGIEEAEEGKVIPWETVKAELGL